MSSRETFDDMLLSKAREAGCVVHEGVAAVAVRQTDGDVVVETDKGSYRGDTLIGADGSMGDLRGSRAWCRCTRSTDPATRSLALLVAPWPGWWTQDTCSRMLAISRK